MAGSRGERLALLAIVVASAAAKVATLVAVAGVDPARVLAADSSNYLGPARALVEFRAYWVAPDVPVPDTLRTPGYPAFLAAIFLLFGDHPVAAAAAQIPLSCLTILLVYRLAARLWSARTGVVAALLVALDASAFGHTLQVLTESLFALLFTAMLVGLEHAVHEPDPGPRERLEGAFAAGLWLALATLVRPVTYYLAGPLALGLVVVEARRRGSRSLLAAAGLVVLPVLLLVGGWQLRNFARTGHGELSQIAGVNMLFYRAAGVVALRDGVDLDEAGRRLAGDRTRLVAFAAQHPEEGLAAKWQAEGAAVLRRHPLLFARTTASGALTLLLAPADLSALEGRRDRTSGPMGDLGRLPADAWVQRWWVGEPLPTAVAFFSLAHLAVIYAGCLRWAALAVRTRDGRIVHAFLWGVALYLLLVSAGPEAYARFRIPLLSVFAVYGAAGLVAPLRANASPSGDNPGRPLRSAPPASPPRSR